jgi:pimeloyl-ACP methyl ester carboxylesterase
LVHGAPDSGRSFARATDHLADLRVLTYDRRGYGRSVDVEPPPRSLGDHAADLIGLLDGRPATVVAHSFGCCVAMLAAVQRPDLVDSLGLWEPPVPWEDWWPERSRQRVASIIEDPDPDAVGERLVRTVLGDAAWERLDADGRRRRRAEGRAFLQDARAQLVRPFHLHEIRVPCMVAYGADTWAPMIESTRRVATSMAAEIVEVPGAGHFGHVTHPAEFAAFARRAVERA